MTRHWRLAAGGTLATAVLAIPATALVGYYSGGAQAASFGYGVAIGLIAYISLALAAALMISASPEKNLALGFIVYMGRLMFAAFALGLPALIGGGWPIIWMVGGFVGVYVVENIALLVGAWLMSGDLKVERLQEVADVERRTS